MNNQYEDISYLQSMYPDSTKTIMETVKATCDQYDYQGSCIYDEYPDRIWIEKISNSIYEQVQAKEPLEAQGHDESRGDFRRNLIDVLLLNEILCRRGWCERGERPGPDRDHRPDRGRGPDWDRGNDWDRRDRRNCRDCRDWRNCRDCR